MHYITKIITVQTAKPIEIVDISTEVSEAVSSSGLDSGQVIVISQHTTASININEKEDRLLEDMETFLKRFAPRDGNYLHNLNPVDGRDNAHSHLLGLKPFPVRKGSSCSASGSHFFLLNLTDHAKRERSSFRFPEYKERTKPD